MTRQSSRWLIGQETFGYSPCDGSIEEKAARATGYRILGHEVDVHGICPACYEKQRAKKRPAE